MKARPTSALARASLAALGALLLARIAACHVDETHARCDSAADCLNGEECYVGYCVLGQAHDAALDAPSDASAERDAGNGLRRRPTPTLSGRAQVQANDRLAIGQTYRCQASDEDGGAGACCERAVACYEGPEPTRHVGRCSDGMRACEGGRLGRCEGSVLPRSETCDNQGTDDDCDGELDNVSELGKACTTESGEAACREGVLACVAGQPELQCVPVAPPSEQCNGKDDDCDNKLDEGFELERDAMNCGACGTRCMQSQTCCAGACVARGPGPDGCPQCGPTQPCGDGRTCCAGSCVDMQADDAHCGACGNACGANQTCCGAMCVNTRADPMHCGACGTVCSEGASPSCCGGRCVDLATDARHCGECGNGCGALCSCDLYNGQPTCRGPLGICF